MEKFRFHIKALSMFLMVCFISFVTTSCDWGEDEPQVEPKPNPTPEERDPLIIESTTLMGYDWNGYSDDLCMMIIKSIDSNPQISANSTQNWVKTFVEKGGNTPDENGYYSFYVMANIDKNDSQTARDFKIKANVKVNYNGSTISESESCSCTQYGYILMDDFIELNKKVAKWQLRSEVAQIKTSDSPEINYIKNDYFDPSKFLYQSPFEVEKTTTVINGVNPNTGEPYNITSTETIISGSYFLGENLDNTFIGPNIYGDYYFIEFIMDENTIIENTETTFVHTQKGLVSISEKELILQYNNADGIYSFYLTALE